MSQIMTSRRYIVVVFAFLILLHSLLALSNDIYGEYTSLDNLRQKFQDVGRSAYFDQSRTESLSGPNDADGPYQRANATFVMLARNSDLEGVMTSMQSVEDRFNSRHNYSWVFLNDELFSDAFKRGVSIQTNGRVSFGKIPKDQWEQPQWIDESKAERGRAQLSMMGMPYADSVPYRNMCRFNSGFFFRHELLRPYRYYWRVEPDVKFFCDIPYDPFKFMRDNHKVYSFTIALKEWQPTVSTLWDAVKEFARAHPEYLAEHNSLDFLSEDKGETYNMCHYWSNFEIADLDFWRSEKYVKFFELLDSKGGFYYERWGDAPIHSIAASLFARRDQVHFFNDMGYRHSPFQHCPSEPQWSKARCSCDPSNTFEQTNSFGSCLNRYESMYH